MPADIGTSYGGFTAATAPSCQPWKWPVNLTILVRPVAARATRIARCVASVPDIVKRVSSAHGTRHLAMRVARAATRSEEHTSELQSQSNLVCRLLLEKKKKKKS